MNNFFAELKRRNVVRVAIAYAVVSWVILQFVDVVAPLMGLPDVFQKGVLVLLAVGAPIALLLSWAYEVTPEGVMKTAAVDASKSIAHGTGQKINKLIVGALVLALGFIAYDQLVEPVNIVQNGSDRQASIAVLPFTDMSPAGDQQYFGDGIAEEILNVLAKIPELKVAGRTSSFKFKGQNENLQLIAEQLNVDHVLEGSIRKDGNKIRITVQLIAADDGFHLWSETYDRDLVDIFAIQDEISQAVAQAMQVQLGTEEGKSGVVKETSSTEAYSLYLRGRQLLHARGAENIENAGRLFEAATVLDPNFSAAWSAQGRVFSLLPLYSLDVSNLTEINKKGTEASKRALDIDPQNAEAYSALTQIQSSQMNWREAEINNEKSILIGPNDAEIANFAGDYYRFIFDTKNAIKWELRAYEIDPLHVVNSRDLAFAYYEAGDYENALKFARNAFEISPNSPYSIQPLVYALAKLGEFDEAHEAIANWPEGEAPSIFLNSQFYLALAEGDKEAARGVLSEMEKMLEANLGDPGFFYAHFLNLGDIERGLFWYERAYEIKSTNLGAVGYILPENFTDDPELIARFEVPGMSELFDIRRANIAKNAEENNE